MASMKRGSTSGCSIFPASPSIRRSRLTALGRQLAPWELGTFLLGTCADVKEAVAAASNVRVGEVVQKDMGFVPGVHYILTDASGKSVVLEYVGGELKVHENPLGGHDERSDIRLAHDESPGNYVNLSVTNVPEVDFGGDEIKGFGQGSGMLGIPGDFTPPSRFVRAVAFSKSALPVKTARDGVLQVFHILNQFDIPKGAARGVDHGKVVADYTLWTSAADLKNLRYHFRTFDDSRVRMVDLRTLDFDAKEIQDHLDEEVRSNSRTCLARLVSSADTRDPIHPPLIGCAQSHAAPTTPDFFPAANMPTSQQIELGVTSLRAAAL